jgi:hypothetical protein
MIQTDCGVAIQRGSIPYLASHRANRIVRGAAIQKMTSKPKNAI